MKKSIYILFPLLSLLHNSVCLAGFFFQQPQKQPCIPCEALRDLRLPDVIIQKAGKIIPEKKDGKAPSPAKPFCQVVGTIGKELNFEVLLPDQWNERFIMGGNGGFAGELIYSLRDWVDSNYVIAGTDVGHKGGLTARWGLDNMERQLNFGHLGIHRTQAVAKAIIRQFYCTDPLYSYFIGLSRGGGQAMMEAQRYPDDFDGIAAGFPAFNWVAWSAECVQNYQKIYPDPLHKEPVISGENLQLLQQLIMKKCDTLDGVRDSILNDPCQCDFNLNELPMCSNDKVAPGCFTKAQVVAIKAVYEGAKSKEGEKIHPGFPFGGEDERGGWDAWIIGNPKSPLPEPSIQAFYGVESFKYLIFNDSTWDYSRYDFANFFKETKYAASYLEATDTDYSAFKSKGKKIIFFQGWADPVISPFGVIQHYEAAERKDPHFRDYARLFMLPGVLHMGGKGPDQVNWVTALRDWVEKGIAPEMVIASKLTKPGEPSMSRPLFPYPFKAVYDGKGDPNKASSFNKGK